MSIQKTLKEHIVGLQHIGHIVADLDAAVAQFAAVYGTEESDIRRIHGDETHFAFVTVGDTEFELIQPVSPTFQALLSGTPSGGAGINHVAWRVRDIEGCMRLLARRGIGPGHVTPDGVVEFEDRRLVYLDPSDTGGLLVELIEIKHSAKGAHAPRG